MMLQPLSSIATSCLCGCFVFMSTAFATPYGCPDDVDTILKRNTKWNITLKYTNAYSYEGIPYCRQATSEEDVRRLGGALTLVPYEDKFQASVALDDSNGRKLALASTTLTVTRSSDSAQPDSISFDLLPSNFISSYDSGRVKAALSSKDCKSFYGKGMSSIVTGVKDTLSGPVPTHKHRCYSVMLTPENPQADL